MNNNLKYMISNRTKIWSSEYSRNLKNSDTVNEKEISSQKKTFLSTWLCSKDLTKGVLPMMNRLAQHETLRNQNPTNAFLPHVTLFSGSTLSSDECQAAMAIFKRKFPEGIKLIVSDFRKNPDINPPVQLIFKFSSNDSKVKLSEFMRSVEQELGLDIDMNFKWLHATLLYKNIPQPLHPGSVALAEKEAIKMIGKTLKFDEYAITTGRAWNPKDIAAWADVTTTKIK